MNTLKYQLTISFDLVFCRASGTAGKRADGLAAGGSVFSVPGVFGFNIF